MTDAEAETRDTAPEAIPAPTLPSLVPEALESLPPPPPQRHPVIPPAPPAIHRMSPMTQRLVMAGGVGGVGSPSSFPQRPSPGGSLKQLLSRPPGAMQRSGSWGAGRMTPTSPYLGSPILSPAGGGNPVSSNGFPLIPNLLSNGGASLSASSQARAAMEKAIQAERTRTKEKEQEEKELTADELRTVLRQERTRMSRLAGEVASLKSTAVACQVEAEVNEEGRINCLMRRLEGLQQEKGRIILELEREEEMLTNNLQKKLNEVKREKAILQQKIEKEQRASAKLKNQLASLDLHQTPITEEAEEEEDEEGEDSETEEEKQEAE